ncbi:MAG: nucleotidyltransferase family protein [Actinomycetota bacterium]|nr:nucleotidyltransferase family protein [Actinomycetota bacterium]
MPTPLSEVDIPMPIRLSLAHAVVDHLARQAKVDLLHIKGQALDPVLRYEDRRSSDVDILVHPTQVDALMAVLITAGFEVRTHFETGSIFRHAANLHHPHWGWVDVHRSFPGIGIPPASAFQQLWEHRGASTIAAQELAVPALLDQALILVLHAARDSGAGKPDVDHLRQALSEQQWATVVLRAQELNAEVAFAAATGGLDEFRNRPEHDLWEVASQGGTRSQEWRARVRAAPSVREKARIVGEAFSPNDDHLRMRLGHEPSASERRRAYLSRPLVALGELKSLVASRRDRRAAQR